jgi:LPXTG-site transpeptidase (sortase) family protein
MARSQVLGAGALAVGVLVGAACAASDEAPAGPAGSDRPAAEAPAASPAPPPGAGSPATGAIRPLPPAAPLPAVEERPSPTSLAVERLGVEDAPVVPVGVRDDGEMDIPAVDQVGWYRFGARPGDEGTSVLAAHVAYDGVDGVFRRLADLSEGDAVRVRFADGTERAFAVTAVARYPKTDLPADVWRRAGAPELVLVTCGGEFDASSRSYEDNVVVYAAPA